MTTMADDDLDRMLAGLRGAGPVPSDALMARIVADAAAVQPGPRRIVPARRGLWAGLAAALGGGGVLAGLATAAAAGLFIGLAAPTSADVVSAAFWGEGTSLDLIPDFEGVADDVDG